MRNNTAFRNWLGSTKYESEFYAATNPRWRQDPYFPWSLVQPTKAASEPVQEVIAGASRALDVSPSYEVKLDWFTDNAELLWETRTLLEDEKSRTFFDAAIVLKVVSPGRFFFRPSSFEPLVTVHSDDDFEEAGFPSAYLALPLRSYTLSLASGAGPQMRFIAAQGTPELLNNFRQYFPRWPGLELQPRPNDVVLDCGSCIGEISLLFAAHVGPLGHVHAFDPIPLHTRFCALQASNNPSLAEVIHINTLAVSNRTFESVGSTSDTSSIAPGGLVVDTFSAITLDEYASSARLGSIDYVKMDVEGSECSALEGARELIARHKPTLAISAYHKDTDFWEIAQLIRSLHPAYKLYFSHHSPVLLESLFYAV